MYKRLFFLCFIFLLTFSVSSCGLHFHDDPQVSEALTPENMDNSFGYQPNTIKPYKCQQACEVALVNTENRQEKYIIWDAIHSASYTPSKFTETVIRYIGDELARRNVRLSSESPTKIMVSLGEAKLEERAFSRGSYFELKIDIPALHYQKIYRGSDASIYWHTALAYAVHHSVLEFLKDPVVVKYIESKP